MQPDNFQVVHGHYHGAIDTELHIDGGNCVLISSFYRYQLVTAGGFIFIFNWTPVDIFVWFIFIGC